MHRAGTQADGTKQVTVLDRNVTKPVLVLVALTLGAFLGFYHVVTGAGMFGITIVPRSHFGYSEVFVNVEAITSMPFLFAQTQYPLGTAALQREGLIESNDAFRRRVREGGPVSSKHRPTREARPRGPLAVTRTRPPQEAPSPAAAVHSQHAMPSATGSQIREAVAKSDDFSTYPGEFIVATRELMRSQRLSLRAVRDFGGWLRSQNYKPRRVYFTYIGKPAHVSRRWYLDVTTGRLFQ